jgi:hypothetical protein
MLKATNSAAHGLKIMRVPDNRRDLRGRSSELQICP